MPSLGLGTLGLGLGLDLGLGPSDLKVLAQDWPKNGSFQLFTGFSSKFELISLPKDISSIVR